ncbi:MAG: hypothetical protein WC412_06450 [Candidatus Omnitrophota bacterium]
MMRKIFTLLLFIIFLSSPFLFLQAQNTEILTIATYYPAPSGVYQNLRLFPTAAAPLTACDSADEEGTMYYNNDTNQLMVCRETSPLNFNWQPVGAGFWTQAGNFLYSNDSDWNVGIGTDNPQRKLHIVGSDNGTPSVLSIQNIDTTDGNGLCLSYRGVTTGVGADNFAEFASVKSRFVNHSASGRVGALDFHVAGPGGSIASTPAMTIDGNWNVGIGIGTGTPQAKIDVAGGVRVGQVDADGNGAGQCDATGCTANNAGTLRYCSNTIQYCDNNTWKSIGGGQFGGVFIRKKAGGAPSCSSNTCVAKNPYTDSCSCPAGYSVYDGNAAFSSNLWCGADYYKLCQCYK